MAAFINRVAEQPSTSGRGAQRSLPPSIVTNGRSRRLAVSVKAMDSFMSPPKPFKLFKGDVPDTPAGYVVPGVRTAATPLLSTAKAVERMQQRVHKKAADHFGAFYSSELGGIVTDPALMMIHMDDHMVHRGHGVFDTALIVNSYMYQLPQHVERLRRSAAAARIPLDALSEERMMRVILDTAAASRKINGMVKYWLTAGRGGFGLSPAECTEPGFYALATDDLPDYDRSLARTQGWKVVTAGVAQKPPPFAGIKSNNYLPNVLAKMQGEDDGCDAAIFVDGDGFVQEGPNMNFGVLSRDGDVVVPPFDDALAGVTVSRLMELVERELQRPGNDLAGVRGVEQRPLHVDEVLSAREAFLVGSSLRVMPVVSWDGRPINGGVVHAASLAMDRLVYNDMTVVDGNDQLLPIPYGYVTGMRSQLT